jgi:hypothetical protein
MSRWKDCAALVEVYEAENLFLFSWVWKIRLDLYFNFPVPHVSLLDPGVFYISNPRKEHAWAHADLFFAVPRKNVPIFFKSVDLVQCDYAEALPECR